MNSISKNIQQDCDELAIRSQQTWGEAKKNGVFDLEMANVEVETKKGKKVRYPSLHPCLLQDVFII
jgi:hypothetical protein